MKRRAIILILFILLLLIVGIPKPLNGQVVILSENFEPIKKDSIKIISYNIHFGSGVEENYMKEANGQERYKYLNQVADIIKEADIVALQEVDVAVPRSHFINELEYLMKKSGMNYAFFAPNWNLKFPFLENPFYFSKFQTGLVTLSKLPFESTKLVQFEKPKNVRLSHKIFSLWRTMPVVEINLNGERIKILNVHLEDRFKSDRISQAEQISTLVSESFTIALGDFNALATNLEDPTINIIKNSGMEQNLQDLTFPANNPDRKLDYIFTTKDLTVINSKVIKTEASDHLPIYSEIKVN